MKSILQKTFNTFKRSSYNGVEGIIYIDSGKKGPCLGITVCTHGNEPSGLVVLDYILREVSLKKGSIFLIVNNMKATEQYLKSRSQSGKQKARFCDINMNRLPKNVMRLHGDKRYEIRRAQDLYPTWKKFSHAVDIHSTSSDLVPMIIGRNGLFKKALFKGVPIKTIISNIDTIQVGVPAFSFYGTKKSSVFAVESGLHESEKSFKRAIETVRALLINLQMIDGTVMAKIKVYKEYEIFDSVFFPDLSYKIEDQVKDFKLIKRGSIIASNPTKDYIKASQDTYPIMISPQPKTNKELREEMMFLSRRPKLRRLT